ncbi:substrate-binding periplasmic protein [Pseudodesulfovibrio tunisiensis]|uniref:substrate-binding periplasmic protein n=1 Tax=Pseudodesulfovibrio tunisiensis TaxID=463192 RepID=UPI001FB3E7BB|nr:transporter substrate-binding domain-containing protein [Pseudodesulfovibrio tunisiensis]
MRMEQAALRAFFLWSRVVLLLLLLFPAPARAQDAHVVRIGIAEDLPPYALAATDSGMEVEILRAAGEAGAHCRIRIVYLPKKRLALAFEHGQVDALAVNAEYDVTRETGRTSFASDITLVYHNYAITLADHDIRLSSLADLGLFRVVGFQNATQYLGPKYATVVALNKHYREVEDQARQVRLLYLGRADVAVADKNIFLYWRDVLQDSPESRDIDFSHGLAFHDIFSPAPRTCVFAQPECRDAFNRGLDIIRANGEYDRILKTYSGWQ